MRGPTGGARGSKKHLHTAILIGSLLTSLHFALALISPRFTYGREVSSISIVAFVGLEMSAGVVYLAAIWWLRKCSGTAPLVVWIIGIGLAIRTIFLASTPIMEDDYYRYLWDGAVTAHGMNPYSFSPSAALRSGVASGQSRKVGSLADEAGDVLRRINNPRLRTIYPPVAEGAFALSFWIKPWSLFVWRLVLLGCDGFALVLLFSILRHLRLPLSLLSIYWWNPVVVKETFNSGHMDVLAVPLVLGAVLLSIRGRTGGAVVAVGVATAVKVWPITLLPLIIRPLLNQPAKLIAALCLALCALLALLFPIYQAGFGGNSGFVAYGRAWENNDALFAAIRRLAVAVFEHSGLPAWYGGFFARILVSTVLVAWIVWVTHTPNARNIHLPKKALLVTAGVFLLSPTQFPWYYIWIMPFLTITPKRSLLMLTVLLPLYYLRSYLPLIRRNDCLSQIVLSLEYLPAWLMIGREMFASRHRIETFAAEG